MSVLKDIKCTECGTNSDTMMKGSQTEVDFFCDMCNNHTRHTTICNGGTKTLPYGIGLDGRDYGGFGESIKISNVHAFNKFKDGTRKACTDTKGNDISKQVTSKSRSEERKHKIIESRKERKLYF